MPCETGAYIGRDALVEVSLACSDTPPVSYLALGGTRSLSINGEWGTIDVTSRSSVGAVREKLVDFIEYSGDIDGTVLKGAAGNIKALRTYIWDPSTGQPKGWVRYTIPDDAGGTETLEFPVIFSNFNYDLTYDAESTFSLSWAGDGAPVFTDVPA